MESKLSRAAVLGIVQANRKKRETLALNGANLSQADLRTANLHAADFNQMNLRQTLFSRANLRGASFIGAELSEANFWRADLVGANLSQANLWQADLSEADLSVATLNRANLTGATLTGATLSEAHLSGANFVGADLSQADLSGVDLSRANLSEANLNQARLYRTNLSGADLSGARLTGATLNQVNLSQVNLSGARIGQTTFDATDLSQVKGLETVRHLGPSTIGIDTLFNARGPIAEGFLRGAGVPEILLASLPTLLGQSSQYYACFIVHAVKDTHFASRLYADLQQAGVRCWYASETTKPGERLREGNEPSIPGQAKLLLILSEHSLTSEWIEEEVEAALEQERRQQAPVLFPVRVDDVVISARKGWAVHLKQTRHVGDFRERKGEVAYQKAFRRLVRDLQVKRG